VSEYERNKLKCVGTDSQKKKKGKGYRFTASIVEVKAPMGVVLNKMTYVGRR
jgi:hypothetical protein